MKHVKKTETSSSIFEATEVVLQRQSRYRSTDSWENPLVIEDKNGSPTHSAVDWGHIALLLGNN
jgi:hypothetical protein